MAQKNSALRVSLQSREHTRKEPRDLKLKIKQETRVKFN